MKKSILLFIFILIILFYSYGQINTVNFGVRFVDTISLPSKDNYIKNVTLKSLPNKESKNFYNTNESTSILEVENSKKVVVIGKNDNKNVLLIPPLKPNKFYQIEVEYIGKYNIYGLFRSMHEEGLILYQEDKNWMDIIKYLNMKSAEIGNKQLLYHPQNYELKDLKSKLVNIDFNKIDTIKLEKIYYSNFEILNFRKDEISIDSLVSFSKWINSKDEFSQLDGIRFITTFNKIPDYLRIYEFYLRRIKPAMDNMYFYDPLKLIEFIKKEAELENQELKARYGNLFPEYVMHQFFMNCKNEFLCKIAFI
ncbi:MAG: hypothetical protein ACFFC1_02160, partial [Promethearchaeota archaeon]